MTEVNKENSLETKTLWQIAALPGAEVAAIAAGQYINMPEWDSSYDNDWMPTTVYLNHFTAIGLAVEIAALLLLIRALYPEGLSRLRFRCSVYLLSLVAFANFFLLPYTPLPPFAKTAAAAAAVGIGMFAFLDAEDFFRRAWRDFKATAVAAVMALAIPGFVLLLPLVWLRLSNATGWVVSALLRLVGIDASAGTQFMYLPWGVDLRVVVATPLFNGGVAPGCSGLEGIFLLFLLISSVMLVDWRIFRHWRLLEVYAAAFICMFLVNCIRIAVFMLFVFGTLSDGGYITDGGQKIRDIFHTHIGWVVYLITFFIFTGVMYHIATRERQREKQPAFGKSELST